MGDSKVAVWKIILQLWQLQCRFVGKMMKRTVKAGTMSPEEARIRGELMEKSMSGKINKLKEGRWEEVGEIYDY